MKGKTPIVIAVILLLLLLGGGYFFLTSKQTSPATTTNQPTSGSADNNVFSSIKDALSKSVSLECNFTDEEGRQTKSFVKAGAVRADFTAKNPEESGSVIMKDKKMYFWNKKMGFMMDLSNAQNEAAKLPTGTQEQNKGFSNEDDVLATLEKYKQSCKPSVVADSLFTPPSDVNFTDYSKMMQPPTGTTQNPGTMNEQQIKDLMQKYGATQPPADENQ